MNKDYEQYLQSPEWKEFRKKAFEHYGRKCSKCNRKKNLQIHHKTYINIFHEELADVMVLCKIHHEEIHGIKQPKKVKEKPQPIKKLNKKQRRKLRRLKRGKLSPIEQHRITAMSKPKYKPPSKLKRINPNLPSPNAILQKKQERLAWQMRVVE